MGFRITNLVSILDLVARRPTPLPPARPLDVDLLAFLTDRLGLAPTPLVAAPLVARQAGATPASARATVSYTLVSEEATMRLGGTAGLACRVLQVDFRSPTQAEAEGLAESCRLATQGYRGMLGTNLVRAIFFKRIPSNFTQGGDNSPGAGTYRAAAELRIWYRQAT